MTAMATPLTVKNLGFAYEVTCGNRIFRVRHEYDGEHKGLWTVKEQSLKDKGVDHWFNVGVEATKRNAIRMIEDDHYAD